MFLRRSSLLPFITVHYHFFFWFRHAWRAGWLETFVVIFWALLSLRDAYPACTTNLARPNRSKMAQSDVDEN